MNGWIIALTVGLLLANAFFVGAEFAIISARRSSMEPRAEAGSRSAKTVLWGMEHVSDMLATSQLGITVCSVSLGVVAEPALAHGLEGPLHSLGLPESSAHAVAVAIALAVIVGLHVVVGEMVPKNAAVSSPDAAALVFGPPLVWIAKAVHPIIVALNWVANAILRLFGVHPQDEVTSAFTADEVHSIVRRSNEEGTLSDDGGLLTGAIEFSDRTAAEVLVPMADLVCVELGASPDDVETLVAKTGFSRFPVSSGGDIIGYLHVKDTLYARPGQRDEPIQKWRVRPLPNLASEAEIEDALSVMRVTGAHVAEVVDDGATVGVVFLEDVIEVLVGEIRDAQPERY